VEAIEYHVGWTYPQDPFNLINPEDVLLRQEFYDILATPTFRMDGLWMGDQSSLDFRYNQHKEWPAPAELELLGTWDAVSREISLRVRATTDAEPPAGPVRLFVALTESEIYWPINGVDWHDHLMFDMLPDGAGTLVDLSGAPPRVAELELTATLPDPGEIFNFDPAHIRVIAWLQMDAPESEDHRLVLQTAGRGIESFGAVGLPETAVAGPQLRPAYPNPFNPRIAIPLELPAAAMIRLSVVAQDGRLLRSLHSGTLAAGPHQFTWDGLDSRGRELPSGVYLLRLESEGLRRGAKLILLR
jgi:hypothetical protein